jgi:hypothetical protein
MRYSRTSVSRIAAGFLGLAALLSATLVGAETIAYVPGTTAKVCQIVGQTDRELGAPTVNQTETRYGLYGTDLGASFEFGGALWMLFGDSVPDATFNGADNLSFRSPDYNDSIAWSTDASPDGCIHLQFAIGATGAYASPVVNSSGPPVTLGNLEVPVSGVSYNGAMYVFFATDRVGTALSDFATKAAVAVSPDGLKPFQYLYTFSADRFVNIATDLAGPAPTRKLPVAAPALLIWGTAGGANYRHSDPYFAAMPLSSIATGAGVRYFAGFKRHSHQPLFSASESDAAPLFNDPTACMGELSVKWNPFIARWMMLYNCDPQGGIVMRLAENPWGPWSAPQIIFDPWRDHGYCNYIHRAWTSDPATHCDNVSDPGREAQWGGWYGPYLLSRYTTGKKGGTTIYYTLSTWNPYAVMLLKSEVARVRR